MKMAKKAVALLLATLMLCSAFAGLQFTTFAAQENIAITQHATATASESETGTNFTPDKVIDGDETSTSSRWATNRDQNNPHNPHWLMLAFEQAQTVRSFRVVWQHSNITDFYFQTSETGDATNNNDWTTHYEYHGDGAEVGEINLPNGAVTAKYFRIYIANYGPATGDWCNVSIMEIALYADELRESLDSVSAALSMPQITADTEKFPLPEVPEGFNIAINGADYEQIIAADGTIRHPLNDTSVKISFILSDEDGESIVTSDFTVNVPGVAEGEVPADANAKPAVIPELAEWQGGEGDYTVSKSPRLIIDTDSYSNLSDKDEAVVETTIGIVAMDFEDITGKKLTVVKGMTDAEAGDIVVSFKAKDSTQLGEEGYKAEIGDSISIESETVTGFFWATRSILQILKQNGDTIPQGITYDYPRYPVRSFMLDVGRTPISLETLYNVMKNMAWYKMNDLQVHLYDNNIFLETYVTAEDRAANDFSNVLKAYAGFRLESDVVNEETGVKLTSEDRYYTKDEFRTFIKTSRACGVNIVPEFDSPAHSLSIVQVYPEWGIKTQWTGHTLLDHLDLANPEVTEFIKNLWREYTDGDDPVFDEYTTLHIGSDEYTYNAEQYRKFVDTMFGFVQDDLNRNVRVWGSLYKITGNTPVRANSGIQMHIWSVDWGRAKQSFDQGYSIINILDQENYIVPAAGYYNDYMNVKSKYETYDACRFREDRSGTYVMIPSGDAKMLGGAYALWNDMTDTYERGMTDYDIFDRFFKPLLGYSSRLWGDAADLTYAQASNVFEITSTAPNSNPYYEVKSKTDTRVQYDFDAETIKDKSGNGYDVAEVKNAQVVNEQGKNALKLNGGESYASTPIDFFGADAELSFSVYRSTDSEDEQILFETSDEFETWAIKAVQKETGKVGFSREKCDFSFDYKLPVGEWVDLKIVGHKDTADLYVNGELVSTVGTAVTSGAADLHATLMIPFARIGSETSAFNGLISDVSVYQQIPFSINDPTIIDRSNFSISSDNYYNGTNEGPASFAIDGDNSTIWHSNYSPYTNLPASLIIDMGETYTIDKFTYVPRQDSSINGIVTSYTLSYKLNEEDEWTDIVIEGTFAGDHSIKSVPFEAVEARYVKFTALDGLTNQAGKPFASAAEVYVHKVLEEDPDPDPDPGMLGDVDSDGDVDSTDATLVLQYFAEIITANDLDLTVADVDEDGIIDSTDATLILQFFAEIISEFPSKS